MRRLFSRKEPDWLRRVPDEWEVRPISSLFRRRVQRGHSDLQPLSVYRDYGVVVREDRDDNFNRLGSNLDQYQRVQPGDLVLNKMKTWQGSLGVSAHEGIVSPAYIVCKPVHGQLSRYLHYLLRSPPYVEQYQRLSYGVRVNQWDMRFEDFRSLPCLIPPLETQRAITSFLDRETARIDTLLEKKRRLLELLKEKRTALITRAVTRGLDPDVPMKDSGVEWIGEIPEHWQVAPIKRLWRSAVYGISDSGREGGRIPVLAMGNVHGGTVTVPSDRGVDEVPQNLLLRSGDLLFNRTNSRDLVGKVGLYKGDPGVVTFASYLVRLRSIEAASPRFLAYLLNSEPVLAEARSRSLLSVNQANLNPTRYGEILVPVPKLEEQERTANHLDRSTAHIDEVGERVLAAIGLLQEYRTALISSAVTGKIDVREQVVA